MKYVQEYRDGAAAQRYAAALAARVTRPWNIMEVCGGQTHAILRFGLDQLLPEPLTLLHGPGCPVCVTPAEAIDEALAIALSPGVTFCSFGDMLRVPGSDKDLLWSKSEGADVRAVYSPLDALALAEQSPERQVVFFAVGFETTAPATAMAVIEAQRRGLQNFSLLVSHVLVPPAMEALLAAPGCRVDAFLAAGHVCAVMGVQEYRPLVEKYRVPVVVTGFEPLDILQGLTLCVRQLESGRAELENQYDRAVADSGNPSARAALHEVFEVVPQRWRGMGIIAQSGLELRSAYAAFDARRRFSACLQRPKPSPQHAECPSGRVLLGQLRPPDCPHFGKRCTPDRPLGAPMVSSEGACAAYYRYRKPRPECPAATSA